NVAGSGTFAAKFPAKFPADRAFEAAIVAEYLPQSPVEKELVHRLASLFWRLRRATSIETGPPAPAERDPPRVSQLPPEGHRYGNGRGGGCRKLWHIRRRCPDAKHPGLSRAVASARPADPARDIAVSFLRLATWIARWSIGSAAT